MDIVVGIHLTIDQWKEVKMQAKQAGKDAKKLLEERVHKDIEMNALKVAA